MKLGSLPKLILFFAGISIISLNNAASGYAESGQEKRNPVSSGSEIDFNSLYLWHGILWNEEPVIQPSFWVSAKNITFSGWSNFVAGNEVNSGRFNEFDFILSFERNLFGCSVEPSFEFSTYPRQDTADSPATGQGILKLNRPIGPLVIFTSQAFDLVKYRGAYFGEAGLSYENKINDRLLFSVSLFFGWASFRFNEVYLGLGKNALNLAEGDIAITYNLTKSIYIRPHMEISSLIDTGLRSMISKPANTNFGLAAGLEF